MNTFLIALLLVAAVANMVLLVTLLLRSSSNQGFAKEVREDLRIGRDELRSSNKQANDTVAAGVHSFTETGRTLDSRVKNLQEVTEAKLEATRGVLDRIRDTVDAKLDTVRQELATGLKKHCDTLIETLDRTGAIQVERLEAMTKQVKEAGVANQTALEQIRATFDTRVEELRQSLDARVKEMQEGNERKLEEMRQTVDEKLQGTLEKRLGESFKFVSDRLEMVHQGLGEMQGLASGVGDLKRIFSNVKVRGTYAEVQLGSVLDQMLTPDQWSKTLLSKLAEVRRAPRV
jgi:DNA recombination protein RmuC